MRNHRRDEFDDYRDTPEELTGIQPPRFLPHFVLVLILIGGSLAAVHYFGGPQMFSRTLEALATPVGIVWIFLFLASYWVMVWRIRLACFLCWTSWLILTLAGNAYVANRLIVSIEAPYVLTDPFELEKFDAVLVLGGGTDTTPAGVPQLGLSGDRLALAARLFHAGKTDKIIVSGLRNSELREKELQLYEESARILSSLKIPDDAVIQLKQGSDTSEELQALKGWLDGQETPPPRIGVITSAWHLRRTMLLAQRHDLNATPIPANVLTEPVRSGPGIVIPSAGNLYLSSLAIREHVARWLDN